MIYRVIMEAEAYVVCDTENEAKVLAAMAVATGRVSIAPKAIFPQPEMACFADPASDTRH